MQWMLIASNYYCYAIKPSWRVEFGILHRNWQRPGRVAHLLRPFTQLFLKTQCSAMSWHHNIMKWGQNLFAMSLNTLSSTCFFSICKTYMYKPTKAGTIMNGIKMVIALATINNNISPHILYAVWLPPRGSCCFVSALCHSVWSDVYVYVICM